MARRRFRFGVGAAAFALVAGLGTARAGGGAFGENRVHEPSVPLGEVAFTLIGQVTNTPPDQSAQFGYLTTITGLDGLFSGPTEDESSAYFTFFNETTTIAVRHNGPMTVIERTGTTTVYYNPVPHASFADPNSFRDGQAILVMSLDQQVIIDTVRSAFSVVIGNNVGSSNPFPSGGHQWVLAHRHDNFRWSLSGHLNAAPPPNGHFASYVVKVQAD